MAEFEELRLTITLVDNATAGIKAMRVELRAVEADSNRFRQKMQELTRDHKDFSTNLNQVNAKTALLAAAAGYAGSKLGELQEKVYEQVTAIGRFAGEMQQINNAARMLGLSFGVLNSLIEQAAKYGMDEGTIKNITAQMLALQAQLKTRAGIDKFRQEMLEQFKLDPQDLEAYIDRLRAAEDIFEFIAATQETGSVVEQGEFRRTQDRGLADLRKQDWFTKQGLPAQLALLGKLDKPTAEYLARQQSVIEAATRWNTELGKIQTNLESIRDTFFDVAMTKDGNFYKALVLAKSATETIAKNLQSWLNKLKTFAKAFMSGIKGLRDTPGAGQLPPELFGPKKQSFGRNDDQIEELTDIIHKINEVVRSTGPRVVPAAFAPGGGVTGGGAPIGGGTAGGGGLFGGAGAFRGLLGGGQGGAPAAPGGRTAALPPPGGTAPTGGGPPGPGGGPAAAPPAPPPGVPAPGVPSAPAPVVPGQGTGGAPFSPGRMRLPGAPYSPGRLPAPGGGPSAPSTPGGGTGGYTPRPGEAAPAGAAGGADGQAAFLAQHRAATVAELQDPAKREAFMGLMQAEVGSQGAQAQAAWAQTTVDRWAARGQTVSEGIRSGYFGGNPRYRTPSDSLRGQMPIIMEGLSRGDARFPGATGNASNQPGNNVLEGHRRRGEVAGEVGGEGFIYEQNRRDIQFRQRLAAAGQAPPTTTAFEEGGFTPVPKLGGYNRADISTLRAGLDRGLMPGTPPTAGAAPIDTSKLGALPDQKDRPGYYGGELTVGGETFPYGTGGGGRGSSPYGTYPVNIGKGDIGPIGQRIGSIATVGSLGGEINDPKYPGAPRAGIQIHPVSGSKLDELYTAGCFGVPRKDWPRFKAALLRENEASGGKLFMTVDRSGRAFIGGQQVAPTVAEVAVAGATREGVAGVEQAQRTETPVQPPEAKEGGFTPAPKRGGFTPVDRTFLDRQMGNKIQLPKADGEGKVSIKVTEPKDVGGTPEGLFKKDTAERQENMTSTKSGPEVEVTSAGKDTGAGGELEAD